MAKRKYSTKRSKIEPSAQTLTFQFSVPPGDNKNFTIDTSQCALLVNRRFYRQGINWAVGGQKLIVQPTAGGNTNGLVICAKLPNTWVMSNAWEKGMRSWMKMNKQALEDTPSVRPKFLDYKIYADAIHHAAGFSNNLLPVALGTGVPATPGEWAPSQIHIPSSSPGYLAADREIIAVGPNYPGNGATGFNAVSLIEGYAASRGLPSIADPNVPDDNSDADGVTPQNWMVALFNDGTQQDSDVLEDMAADNNIAPYPFENDGVNTDTMYPGGANQLTGLQIHDYSQITNTSLSSTTRLKGGNFPCGLIRYNVTNTSESTMFVTLMLDMVPGSHRGYLCEPMTEM
ncbi:MAG: hypothetical protein [Circular genetic element sp.]|nr:MAG: hypothetical protein [Circular genetic element sp.]